MDNLKNFIKDLVKDCNLNITDVYVSKNKVNIEEVMDTFKTTIFTELKNIKGYLIFIDPCTLANWSHHCNYVFYVNSHEYYKQDGTWMPHSNLGMELIELIEEDIIKEDIIKDPNKRWEKGISHHPMSEKLFDFISSLDFECGDIFCFKKGGDGDNGEHLMYLMDVFFETQDKEK